MIYIGDIHGNFQWYYNQLKKGKLGEASVQVGDFGLFGGKWADEENYWMNLIQTKDPGFSHNFIRGNHDNPTLVKETPRYIPDGTIHYDERGRTVMYIGGAASIDKVSRVEGKTWWAEEGLTFHELFELHDIYDAVKPDRMVTHDCPESIAGTLFYPHYKFDKSSVTRQCFDSMFSTHKPKEWIFGHWHSQRLETVQGTKFICLGINQILEV